LIGPRPPRVVRQQSPVCRLARASSKTVRVLMTTSKDGATPTLLVGGLVVCAAGCCLSLILFAGNSRSCFARLRLATGPLPHALSVRGGFLFVAAGSLPKLDFGCWQQSKVMAVSATNGCDAVRMSGIHTLVEGDCATECFGLRIGLRRKTQSNWYG